MSVRHALSLGLMAIAVCAAATGQGPDKSTSLDVVEEGDKYVLTVPVSRLVMTIPKDGLVRGKSKSGGSTDSPRYFFLENKAVQTFVSGWFESAQGFTNAKQLWAGETAAWKKQGSPEPHDVSFEKVGSWDAVSYDVSAAGLDASHIRAHWVQAGTWIDIHISLTSNAPQAQRRATLRELLTSIQVSEKKP